MRARDDSGAQATAFTQITPTQDAGIVDPVAAWSVPDALLGGLDVASPAVGGVMVPAYDPSAEMLLYDGLAVSGGGFGGSLAGGKPVELTVDLAGDAPVPVAGIMLDPLGGDGTLAAAPRAVELLLSAGRHGLPGGVVGRDEPDAHRADIRAGSRRSPARFARLRISSTWGDSDGPVTLGEWKVVATPGVTPMPGPLNIADPVRGGHVVWMDPQPGSPDVLDGMLTEDPKPWTSYLPGGTPISWVTGFQDDRAAQVTGLQWVDPPGSDPAKRFPSVDVQVSVESPLGPWQDVGTWQLERAADGSVAPFTFDPPTWARFIRLSGQVPAGDCHLLGAAVDVPGDGAPR